MQINTNNKDLLANEIKNERYIDNYIDKWLKLETVDKPYVECEICGYASNASIHQHLLIPKEFDSGVNDNRILHLCANCNYELRALINKYQFVISDDTILQMSEKAFKELKDKKEKYRQINQTLERIEV